MDWFILVFIAFYVVTGVVLVRGLEDRIDATPDMRAARVITRLIMIIFWLPIFVIAILWMFGDWFLGWIFS